MDSFGVLGQMVGVEARAVVGLGDAQSVLVIVRKRAGVTVEMVEDAELHSASSVARGNDQRSTVARI